MQNQETLTENIYLKFKIKKQHIIDSILLLTAILSFSLIAITNKFIPLKIRPDVPQSSFSGMHLSLNIIEIISDKVKERQKVQTQAPTLAPVPVQAQTPTSTQVLPKEIVTVQDTYKDVPSEAISAIDYSKFLITLDQPEDLNTFTNGMMVTSSMSLNNIEQGKVIYLPEDRKVPVSFEWGKVDGAKNYLLEISLGENFSNLVLSQTIDGASYSVIPNKIKGKTFFWRVLALNGSSRSKWSKTQKVKIKMDADI